MMKRRHIIYYYIALVALMLTFVIYTATRFPYTYITMESDDYWALTTNFWQLKLSTLPAVTQWLADFMMQFFSKPFVAAGIEALILGAIGMLGRRTLSWLALLPPVLLGFFCTFSLSFLLQWLFFFLLLQAHQSIPGWKGQLLWSLMCVPLGFLLMRTPVLALLIACQAGLVLLRREKRKAAIATALAGGALLVVTPLIYSQQVSFIPFEERYTAFGTYFDPLTSRYNHDGEYVKRLVCLSNEERWTDILYKEHAKSDAIRGNSVALRYALLAESALGTLPENLLDYPIREESQFLYPHKTEYVALQLNRLFYLNLGVFDEAYHHAQEYGQLRPNGVCFSSLRQMVDYSIEEGDVETARKFLHVLSKTSCHKAFIDERRKKLSERERSVEKRQAVPLRADNFVGGFPLPIEMLRLARYYGDVPERKKMLDYAICSYMLRGDAERFAIATRAFDVYKDKPLPKAYREFWERYVSTASTTSAVSNPL